MKRRGFLGTVAAGVLAGCLSRGSSGGPSTPTDADPTTRNQSNPSMVGTATHAGRCAMHYEPHVGYVDYPTVTDQLDGVVLTASTASVRLGEEISFSLTNKFDERKGTGNRSKYDVHHRTEEGWQSVFWRPTDELVAYHDDSISHSPDEGFTWDFTITSEGLSHEIQNGPGHLKVCTPLRPGSYRFVFHGQTTHEEAESGTRLGPVKAALGTQFTVVES